MDAGTSTAISASTEIADPVPIQDARGKIIGYAVSSEVTQALKSLDAELQSYNLAAAKSSGDQLSTTVDGWRIVKCTAAVAAFIGLTVFPTARAAKVAVRLARYVKKYGTKKVVQIMTRTYKGQDKDKLFIEFAKELTGVAAPEVCWG